MKLLNFLVIWSNSDYFAAYDYVTPQGLFPDKIKIVKVSPNYIKDASIEMENCR